MQRKFKHIALAQIQIEMREQIEFVEIMPPRERNEVVIFENVGPLMMNECPEVDIGVDEMKSIPQLAAVENGPLKGIEAAGHWYETGMTVQHLVTEAKIGLKDVRTAYDKVVATLVKTSPVFEFENRERVRFGDLSN